MEKSIARHKNLAIEHSEEAGNRREELVLEHLCPECGGPLVPDLNEVVCRKCGVIITENPDESGPEEKQISVLKYNRKIWQEFQRMKEHNLIEEADLQSLKCQRVGSEEIKCHRCGRYGPYSGQGRKPEHCVACKPIMEKERKKRYAERNRVKVLESAKIGMRKLRLRRRLDKDTDLAKIDILLERQK